MAAGCSGRMAKRMPLHKATRIAANVGKAFAIIFGIVGLIFFNPFLILIALFVYIGATGIYHGPVHLPAA